MHALLELVSCELVVHDFPMPDQIRAQLLIRMRHWLIHNQKTVDLKT